MTEKSEQTRERILEAALEEFSEKGPAGARVNEIAAKAGINKERLYAYYGNKEGLFVAVLEHTFALLQERDQALLVLTKDDIPNLTSILLQHNMNAHAADPHLWRMLAWENLSGATHLDAIRNLDTRGYKHVQALYEQGQQSGHFDADVSFQTYISVTIGLAFFYHSNRLTMSKTIGRNLATPAARSKFLDEALRMLSA